MAKGNKFGTFGGVFTPSILTILGVIMYLRLPWIIGHAGLWASIGIILVAHVISVTTGLSVASIATDKSVQAGGPYYIVSRSLGLPLGGTLGLALAVGLSFSISLYIIGFCESLLGYLKLELTVQNIRIYGTITLIGLTVVTLISTSLAIKTQYVILVAIIASLFSIFLGDTSAMLWQTGPIAPEAPHLGPNTGDDAVPMATLFGIFFPAVTGFTAGVNMSGDLRDAKRSIPRGTIAAIAVGLVTYLALAIYFAYSVGPELLREDKNILLKLAMVPEAVVAGIWGATLSSALGSILGAPRIFQALALDRVIPTVFATGHGKTNEPRTALVLAFVLAEAGILIAELDAIAAIVSMFFMATYGFLNLSCAVESWASPDFRPEFRIPRWVSVLGAVVCVLLMIQLEPLATAGAVALLTALFVWLKRRELVLESGDTWGGVWASLARSALHRLDRGTRHARNWRPNVLMFRFDEADPDVFEFGQSLIGKRGVLTEFVLTEAAPLDEPNQDLQGVFRRHIPTNDPWTAAVGACQFHGFSGLEPNTILLPAREALRQHERFLGLGETAEKLDFNLLVFDVRRPDVLSGHERLDLWWDDGNTISWIVAVTRFLTASEHWHRARVRVMVPSQDADDADRRFKIASRHLREARISAELRVVYPRPGDSGLGDLVIRESDDAALTVVSVPEAPSALSAYVDALPAVLLARPASLFRDEDAPERRPKSVSSVPADELATQESVAAPPAPEIQEMFELSQAEQQSLLAWMDTRAVVASRAELDTLLAEGRKTILKQFQQAARTRDTTTIRLARSLSRSQTALLFQAQKLVQSTGETVVVDWRERINAAAESLEDTSTRLLDLAPGMVDLHPEPSALEPAAEDPTYLRRLKARRRRAAWLTRSKPRVSVPARGLARYWLIDQTAHGWRDTVSELMVTALDVVLTSGRIFIDASVAFERLALLSDAEDFSAEVERERDAILLRFDELASRLEEQTDGLRRRLRRNGQRHLAALADDLIAIDATRRLRGHRQAARDVPEVSEFASPIGGNLALVFQRVANTLAVASFNRRLRTITERTRSAVILRLESGPVRELERLHQLLSTALTALDAGESPTLPTGANDGTRFDDERVIGDLVREISTAVRDLPESIDNLDDVHVDALEAAPLDDVDSNALNLRRHVQFVVEAELVGGLRGVLSRIPAEEQRALEVAQDVLRLVAFHAVDAERPEEDREGQLSTVLRTSITRLETERDQLTNLVPTVDRRFNDTLGRVSERLSAWCRTGSPDALRARLDSERRLSGVGRVTRQAGAAARNVLARAIYQRNVDQMVRTNAQRATPTSTAEPVLELVQAITPRPGVLESLPFYYHQLFLGRSVLDKAFWVGRRDELSRLASAVDSWRGGFAGGALVVGERLSGRGSLARYGIARHFPAERTVHVPGPSSGMVDIHRFGLAVQKAVGGQGSADDALGRLPERTVVHFAGLERWWERRTGGFDVLEHIISLIDRHGHRCFFVMDMNVHAYRFASQFVPIRDAVLSVIETGPMPAADLKTLITLRHRSTGLQFSLDGKSEDVLPEWTTARLFGRYYDVSGGRVGAALQTWISSIRRVQNDELRMLWPSAMEPGAFDSLSADACALLVQLTLHQCADRARLLRVTGLPEAALDRQLQALRRMGVIDTRHDDGFETNRYVDHLLTEHLRQRGMLT